MRQGYRRQFVARMTPEDRLRLTRLIDYGIDRDKDLRAWAERLVEHCQRRIAVFADTQAGRILADLAANGHVSAIATRNRVRRASKVLIRSTGKVHDFSVAARVPRRTPRGAPTGDTQLSYFGRLTERQWAEFSATRHAQFAGHQRSEMAVRAIDGAWNVARGRVQTTAEACSLAGVDLARIEVDL